MANLFLYGTLRHRGLLELVSGQGWERLAPEPARLAGYRACWAEGHGFPLIEEAAGGEAVGLLLRGVGGEVLERLNFYELGFGYALRDVEVDVAGGRERAQIYFPQPGLWKSGAAFSLEDWERDVWPLTRHSAAEVMGYFGRLSGAQVAARYGMILTRAAAAKLAGEEETPATIRSGRGRETVEQIGEAVNHAGFFLSKTLELRHPRFDGAMSEALKREVFVPGDAAILLPYDPLRDRVMLVEQFRMGPYVRGDRRPWVLEPIAGRIDGSETPEEAAIREAREEAGLSLKRLERVGRTYATPGYSTEMFHNFLGIADLPDDSAGHGGLADEHEDIRSHVLAFPDAMALLESGEINVAPLAFTLLWLARERERLRREAGA